MTREQTRADGGPGPAPIPSTLELKACYQRHMLYGTLLSCLLIVIPTLVLAYWPDGVVPPIPPDDDDTTKVDTIFIEVDDPFGGYEVEYEEPEYVQPGPPRTQNTEPGIGDFAANVEIVDDTTLIMDTTIFGGGGGDPLGPDDGWDPLAPPGGGGTVYIPDTNAYQLLDEVEQRPEMINMPQPEYPPLARRAGMEGLVVLHVLVDIDGSAREVRVYGEKPEGFSFGDYAARAAEKATFAPAIHSRQPVRCWVSFTVKFEVE